MRPETIQCFIRFSMRTYTGDSTVGEKLSVIKYIRFFIVKSYINRMEFMIFRPILRRYITVETTAAHPYNNNNITFRRTTTRLYPRFYGYIHTN